MESMTNQWLGRIYKWLMPVALVAAISVAAVTLISAASDGEQRHSVTPAQEESSGDSVDADKDCDDRGHGRGHGRGHWGDRSLHGADIAELVGTDSDGLKAALAEGQTLAEIAEANDVDPQSVIDALVEAANERIDAAVVAGKLSEDDAEVKRSESAEKIEQLVNEGRDSDGAKAWGRGHGGKRGYVR